MIIEVTPEELDDTIDGLCEALAIAEHNAEVWSGRSREGRYRREAERCKQLIDKYAAIRDQEQAAKERP